MQKLRFLFREGKQQIKIVKSQNTLTLVLKIKNQNPLHELLAGHYVFLLPAR